MKKKEGIVVDNSVTQFKYAPKKSLSKTGKPRKIFPHNWCTGPDYFLHELYYAHQKHRSQANYRGEAYNLTWEDWQAIWSNPTDFHNRGRKPEDLTLTRVDPDLPWELSNCVVMTRLEQLRAAMVYKMRNKF